MQGLLVFLGCFVSVAVPTCEHVQVPMGWNSYDSQPGRGGAPMSGNWGLNESTTIQSAAFVAKHLKGVGYEYIVLDAGWFGPNDGSSMTVDQHGRLLPNTTFHPSSAGGAGFKPLADKVHSFGLKFGFWIMGGIPRKAVGRNLSILGSNYTVDEAADLTGKRDCGWQPGFVHGTRLDANGTALHPAAIAYYNSVGKLYDEWGIDFIKIDCVFGGDYGRGQFDMEQFAISMSGAGHSIVLSLSPGSSDSMALVGQRFVSKFRPAGQKTMARMSGDFWDSWGSLKGHFQQAANMTSFVTPEYFPDLDMLPLGWVCPFMEPCRYSRFNEAEVRSLMTLMTISRAPLIWGGHATEDEANATTVALLANAEVLNVSRNSCGNRQISRTYEGVVIWAAAGRDPGEKYIAMMNIGENISNASLSLWDPAIPGRALPQSGLVARDLWLHRETPIVGGKVRATLQPHASLLLLVHSTLQFEVIV